MAISDLVTTQRASQSSTLASLAASNAAYLASLVSAASAAVREYCMRDFTLTAYSEYHNGDIYRRKVPLLLRQYPVTEITRIAANPTQAVQVSNIGGTTAQRATVETLADSTGANTDSVKLAWVSSGVAGSTTLSAATYPTLQALVGAINAVGHGFGAILYQTAPNISTGLIATSDLRPQQGASSCIGPGAYLSVWLESLSVFPPGFWDGGDSYVLPIWGYQWESETGELYGRFPRGSQNIRVDYTAGYATVPQDVQEATVQLVQHYYNQSATNSAIKSARLGNTAVTFGDAGLPKNVTDRLDLRRAYSRAFYR